MTGWSDTHSMVIWKGSRTGRHQLIASAAETAANRTTHLHNGDQAARRRHTRYAQSVIADLQPLGTWGSGMGAKGDVSTLPVWGRRGVGNLGVGDDPFNSSPMGSY